MFCGDYDFDNSIFLSVVLYFFLVNSRNNFWWGKLVFVSTALCSCNYTFLSKIIKITERCCLPKLATTLDEFNYQLLEFLNLFPKRRNIGIAILASKGWKKCGNIPSVIFVITNLISSYDFIIKRSKQLHFQH